jgi:hypothetical protein
LTVKPQPVNEQPKIAIRSGNGSEQSSFTFPSRTPTNTSSAESTIEQTEDWSNSQKTQPLPGNFSVRPTQFSRYITLSFGFVILLSLIFNLVE